MGLFTHDASVMPHVKSVLYEELDSNGKMDENKIIKFFDTVFEQNSGKPTKFACSDTVWFAKNHYSEEHQKAVSSLDQNVVDNSVVLCCYSLTNTAIIDFDKILKSKPVIVLDAPYRIFKPDKI